MNTERRQASTYMKKKENEAEEFKFIFTQTNRGKSSRRSSQRIMYNCPRYPANRQKNKCFIFAPNFGEKGFYNTLESISCSLKLNALIACEIEVEKPKKIPFLHKMKSTINNLTMSFHLDHGDSDKSILYHSAWECPPGSISYSHKCVFLVSSTIDPVSAADMITMCWALGGHLPTFLHNTRSRIFAYIEAYGSVEHILTMETDVNWSRIPNIYSILSGFQVLYLDKGGTMPLEYLSLKYGYDEIMLVRQLLGFAYTTHTGELSINEYMVNEINETVFYDMYSLEIEHNDAWNMFAKYKYIEISFLNDILKFRRDRAQMYAFVNHDRQMCTWGVFLAGGWVVTEGLFYKTVNCSQTFPQMSSICNKPAVPVIAPECVVGFSPCDDGTCIASYRQCDHNIDCPDASDEENCQENRHSLNCEVTNQINYNDTSVFLLIHLCDGKYDCPNKFDEDICRMHDSNLSGSSALDLSLYHRSCDNVTRTENISLSSQCMSADDDHLLSCPYSGGSFPLNELCVFRKQSSGQLKTCSSGDHLWYCENMGCSGMLKCLASYCLPIEYICDGVVDCPRGEDELSCSNMACPGLFKCSGERHCIKQSEICDGRIDCGLTGDDELQCTECHMDCTCTGKVLQCNITKINILSDMFMSNYVALILPQIRSLHMPTMSNLFLSNIIYLNITGCYLHTLNDIYVKNVIIFVASECQIKNINQGAFLETPELQHLNLSNNYLSLVTKHTFLGADILHIIDLSDNYIHLIEDEAFSGLTHVKHINLLHNPLASVGSQFIQSAHSIIYIYTDQHWMCCKSQLLFCVSFKSKLPTCYWLLESLTFSSIVGLSCICIISVCLYVIKNRYEKLSTNKLLKSSSAPKRTASLLVVNVMLSHIIYLLFYVMLVGANLFFRDQFSRHVYMWVHCRACMILSMVYHACHTQYYLISLVMSCHRFLLVKYTFLLISNLHINRLFYGVIVFSWCISCAVGLFTGFKQSDDFSGLDILCITHIIHPLVICLNISISGAAFGFDVYFIWKRIKSMDTLGLQSSKGLKTIVKVDVFHLLKLVLPFVLYACRKMKYWTVFLVSLTGGLPVVILHIIMYATKKKD